jgi:triacylglycerol lipase
MGRPLVNSEAILYGKLVQAAYTLFKREPLNLRPEPESTDIPDPYEFVAWIHMSDFIFGRTEPRFYGYIARNKNTEQDFILAIRGTEGFTEWWDDAKALLVPFAQVSHAGRVAQGFDKIYSTLKIEQHPRTAVGLMETGPLPELQGSFGDQLEQLHLRLERVSTRRSIVNEKKGRPERPYVVTGHSLGAALTTLFVMENKEKQKFDITTSCKFASPRVGNKFFVQLFNTLSIDSWRIVNSWDLVPKLPLDIPIIFDYEHVNTAYEFSAEGMVKSNPGCWHSMETYLHWLDPSLPVDDNCKP